MDQHDHDGQASQQHEEAGPNRRKFLRQAGLTAAATAAVVGAADAFGMTPALASTQKGARAKRSGPMNITRFSDLPPAKAKKLREIRERDQKVHPDSSICCYVDPNHCGGPCSKRVAPGVWCHICYNSVGYAWYSCIGGDSNFCF